MLSKPAALFTCVCLSTLVSVAAPETSSNLQGMTQDPKGLATLPVLVLDRQGNPLTDLNKNELELYEGKEEQVIETLSRNPGAPLKLGVLIDRSKSATGSLLRLKLLDDPNPAEGLLRTGDYALVAMFTEITTSVCPLTKDPGVINKAIHTGVTVNPPGADTSLYDAIFGACGMLSSQSDRKAIIILSDMEDNSSHHTREEATALAQRSGIIVYPVRVGSSAGAAGESRREEVCRLIARGTGGVPFAAFEPKALKAAFRSIRADLDGTYIIACQPKSQGSASIKVRCTRKGVKIIAPDRRH
jgi:Ca-activated chloride channel family protein